MPATNDARIARLIAFTERAAERLHADERARVLWLTGSLAAQTAEFEAATRRHLLETLRLRV